MSTQETPTPVHAEPASVPHYVTAEVMAGLLGVSTKSIYRHADELGAVRIGRAIRFDPTARLSSVSTLPAEKPVSKPDSAPRRRAKSTPHCHLLPVGRRNH